MVVLIAGAFHFTACKARNLACCLDITRSGHALAADAQNGLATPEAVEMIAHLATAVPLGLTWCGRLPSVRQKTDCSSRER